MNPYHSFVSSLARLVVEGKSLPLGGFPVEGRPATKADAPVALLFSPHPDDECIVGGLALRLMREAGMRVINVAVTLGSNAARQLPRRDELQKACHWLGFDLEQTAANGLESVSPATRTGNPQLWAGSVKAIADSLAKNNPRIIFFPHEQDWNRTHVGTHFLIMDALKSLPTGFECLVVETEFWGQLPAPNLMVESSVEDVADLVAALSFHVEEVRRNPYHLRLPTWMQDNVRRGAELVGGQGGVSPDFTFATLYRIRQWRNGAASDLFGGGKFVGVRENSGIVLGLV